MGARCVIQICDHHDIEEPVARIYLHWGGECFEEVASTLRAFCAANESSPDPRWTDAPYLAARFVVWAADHFGRSGLRNGGEHPLNFLSVGVVDSDAWGDHLGRIITAGQHDDWQRPIVESQDDTHDGWCEVQVHWQGSPAASGGA